MKLLLIFLASFFVAILLIFLMLSRKKIASSMKGGVKIGLQGLSLGSFLDLMQKLLLVTVIVFAGYLIWHFTLGRKEVQLTHYLQPANGVECNEENAVGEVTTITLRRFESPRFTVPVGYNRCYITTPEWRLKIRSSDGRRVHRVSLD